MAKFILKPYESNQLKEYQEFALRNWGDTYQASPNYLQWLYKENPSTNKKETDFLLALDLETNKIIGVIHKMRLPWLVNNTLVDIPAIHNLLVEEKYRQGSGLFLITGSLKGDEHIFVPGVKAPLSQAYDMLRCQLMPVQWYRKILSIFPSKLKFTPSTPDSETIQLLTDTLNNQPATTDRPFWTKELVTWRFFHPMGPKHYLFSQEQGFAIISIGKRKGLNVARIIESANITPDILAGIEKQLGKIGINVFLVFTPDKKLQQIIPYHKIKNPPKTYIYHKDRKDFTDFVFSASAGDFGLESII